MLSFLFAHGFLQSIGYITQEIYQIPSFEWDKTLIVFVIHHIANILASAMHKLQTFCVWDSHSFGDVDSLFPNGFFSNTTKVTIMA